MSEDQKQAVIYCRVSSRGQEALGHGLESQETRCRQYAEAKGYEVAMVFPDTFTGGGDYMERPGMVAMLSFLDAQPDKSFVVIFDDLKRASRDTRAFLNLRDAFRDRNASVECLNFKLGDSPEDEFIETIIAAQGALERKQNGRQVSQKMKARMENGYWIHRAPIGMRYTTERGRGKVLVPDPPFDAIIREAFEGFASGRFATQAEVQRFFESFPDFPRNYRGEVTRQRVADILTQPVYAGYICSKNYGIHWLKAQHEGLVSMDVFDQVQKRRSGAARAPQRKNIGDHFALRGIVECGCCGVPLRSSFAKGRSKHYAYYLCQTKGCEAYGKSIKRDQLEDEVGGIIKSIQPAPSAMRMLAAMFRHIWDARWEQVKAQKKRAMAELRDLDKRIDTLMQRILNAQSDAIIPVYEGEVVALERGKAVLSDQIQNMAEPKGSFEEKLEPALRFLASPWKLWESDGPHRTQMRRLVLKLTFAGRIKYDRNQGARTAEISFPFKGLEGVSYPNCGYGAGGGT